VSFRKFLRLAFALAFSFASFNIWAGQSTPGNEPPRGSLAWHAQKARSEGKSEITLPVIYEYPEPEPLDGALAHNALVLATLLETQTVAYESNIVTWRKLKVIEWLSTQSQELSPELDQRWRAALSLAPKSMLPLAADEFLMDDEGGTATVEGVKITMTGRGTQELAVGSRHLMFLLFDSTRQTAGASFGPDGLFTIDDSDTVHARLPKVDSDQNSLLHEIRQRADGKLAGLRALSATVTNSH
jgi:hypothetical protein